MKSKCPSGPCPDPRGRCAARHHSRSGGTSPNFDRRSLPACLTEPEEWRVVATTSDNFHPTAPMCRAGSGKNRKPYDCLVPDRFRKTTTSPAASRADRAQGYTAMILAFFGVVIIRQSAGCSALLAIATFSGGSEYDSGLGACSPVSQHHRSRALEQQAGAGAGKSRLFRPERRADGGALCSRFTTRDWTATMLPNGRGLWWCFRRAPPDSNLDSPRDTGSVIGFTASTRPRVRGRLPAGQWDLVLTFSKDDEKGLPLAQPRHATLTV